MKTTTKVADDVAVGRDDVAADQLVLGEVLLRRLALEERVGGDRLLGADAGENVGAVGAAQGRGLARRDVDVGGRHAPRGQDHAAHGPARRRFLPI